MGGCSVATVNPMCQCTALEGSGLVLPRDFCRLTEVDCDASEMAHNASAQTVIHSFMRDVCLSLYIVGCRKR